MKFHWSFSNFWNALELWSEHARDGVNRRLFFHSEKDSSDLAIVVFLVAAAAPEYETVMFAWIKIFWFKNFTHVRLTPVFNTRCVSNKYGEWRQAVLVRRLCIQRKVVSKVVSMKHGKFEMEKDALESSLILVRFANLFFFFFFWFEGLGDRIRQGLSSYFVLFPLLYVFSLSLPSPF